MPFTQYQLVWILIFSESNKRWGDYVLVSPQPLREWFCAVIRESFSWRVNSGLEYRFLLFASLFLFSMKPSLVLYRMIRILICHELKLSEEYFFLFKIYKVDLAVSIVIFSCLVSSGFLYGLFSLFLFSITSSSSQYHVLRILIYSGSEITAAEITIECLLNLWNWIHR